MKLTEVYVKWRYRACEFLVPNQKNKVVTDFILKNLTSQAMQNLIPLYLLKI